MAIRTTEAVVLKTQPFRNASLIVTAFTRDFGKIQGLAKGIRRRCDRKDTRYHCYLEPLTLDKIVYYEKNRSQLYAITQCDLLNQFQAIRRDLKKLIAASFILEFVEKGTSLSDPGTKDVYRLLVDSLEVLCLEKNIDQVLLLFEIKFLGISGFMPQVKACARCGSKGLDAAKFSILNGGLVCRVCSAQDISAVSISKGAIASMLHLAKDKRLNIKRFKLTGKVEEELKGIMYEFVKMHFSGEFKTLEFMEKVKNG
jgi:DNA repair protein RecO (recombination protein O)